MMISTRGRYAIRVLIDLAEHCDGSYVPLKEVAKRQDISFKYLESIMVILSKAGAVEVSRGKGGGYKLGKAPEDFKIGDILRLTEGSLAPVECLSKGAKVCPKAAKCRTLPMWIKLDKMINEFFDGITLADFMKERDGGDYII